MLARLKDTSFFYVFVLLLLVIVLSLINFFNGIGQDSDTYLILTKAKHYKDYLIFSQSRTWGFPLYEIHIYPIISYLGENTAKLISLFFTLISAITFFKINILLSRDVRKSFLISLIFVVNPFIIISSNSILETSQGLAMALLGLYFLIQNFKNKNTFHFAMFFLALATATRPDYILLSLAAYLSSLAYRKEVTFRDLIIGFGYLLLSVAPFLFLYDDFKMPFNIVNSNNMQIKSLRVVLGYVSLFGIPIYLYMLYLAKNIRLNPTLKVLFFLTFFLYTVRYLLLPDEVEYVLIIFPISLLFLLTKTGITNKKLILLVLLSIMPNLIQVHLFDRKNNGLIKVQPGITYGAFIQEKSMRNQNKYTHGDLKKELLEIVKINQFKNIRFGPSTERDVIVFCGTQELRIYVKGRESKLFNDNFSSQLILSYPLQNHKGWKEFTKFSKFERIKPNQIKIVENVDPLQFSDKKIRFK